MSYRRTLVAAALTTVMVLVPAATGLVVGRSLMAKKADLEANSVKSQAYKNGLRLAQLILGDLETLRGDESRRSFFEYQNLLYDPHSAAEGPAITLSPLADGPEDPWISVHFQIDENGSATLPTLNEELPELGFDSAACTHLKDLEEIEVFAYNERLVSLGGPVEQVRTVSLDAAAWRQHLEAEAIYARIKYRQPSGGFSDAWASNADLEGEEVEIVVGSFGWHTLPVAGEISLVALRELDTPVGPWTQGFVVSGEKVQAKLDGTRFPARFQPAALSGIAAGAVDETTIVPLEGTGWELALDMGDELGLALTRVAGERRRLSSFFAFLTLMAAISGLLVVAMVYQSERLAAQRARFAAHAAHELRTPLAGLRLYSEMLAEGLGDPQRSRDYARRLSGEAERLGRVVTNVLSFTRLERKTLSLRMEDGNLAEVVEETLARQRPVLEEAGAAVELQVPPELPAVRFDRDAVVHILQNLLDNAEKYTRDIDGRKIEVKLWPTAKAVILSVADNGRGISRQLRRRLFRPFARGVSQDGPEGIGLGLVLVRALAAAQGGEVAYADGPAGGAVFSVTFPR